MALRRLASHGLCNDVTRPFWIIWLALVAEREVAMLHEVIRLDYGPFAVLSARMGGFLTSRGPRPSKRAGAERDLDLARPDPSFHPNFWIGRPS